ECRDDEVGPVALESGDDDVPGGRHGAELDRQDLGDPLAQLVRWPEILARLRVLTEPGQPDPDAGPERLLLTDPVDRRARARRGGIHRRARRTDHEAHGQQETGGLSPNHWTASECPSRRSSPLHVAPSVSGPRVPRLHRAATCRAWARSLPPSASRV